VILRSEVVEQVIDAAERVTLAKDVVMTPGPEPLGMVRKRLPEPAVARGTVLLVHGFGQNRYTFHLPERSFSAYLAREGWDVFNLDLRGHGRSRRFGSERPRLLDEYVREDVPACAREAMRLSGHDSLFLVGHSMGGIIGYGAAATSLRDTIRGTITIGSPYAFGLGSRTLSSVSALLGALRLTGLLDRNPHLPLRFVGRQLRLQRALWDSRLLPLPIRAWAPGAVEDEVLESYLTRAFDWSTISIALDIFRAGKEGILSGRHGDADRRTAFEWLDRPLLVIAGSADKIAPPASVEPAFSRSRSSDKTYRVFPLGHIDLIVGREAPRTVWPLIAGWMSKR
jgi:alpha-beta hydrolase superfamily lysophospholipase